MSKAIAKTIERVFIELYIHCKYNKIGTITRIIVPV